MKNSRKDTLKSSPKLIEASGLFRDKFLVDISSLKLSIHVYGIAVDDDKVLISPQYGGYDYPGGTLELGETHLETLKREFKEETGLDIEPISLLNVYSSFFHHDYENTNSQSLLVYYSVKITSGTISTTGFDKSEQSHASEAKWLTLDEIRQMRHACSIDIADELLKYAADLQQIAF